MTTKLVRPNKDEYFMGVAHAVSRRSTCIRHQIGAVIVDSVGRIASTGYNGAPKNFPHCSDIGCLRNALNIPSGEQQQKCRAVHAEQNAIMQASSHGVVLDAATIYCGFYPCIICTKMIINAGILHVVYTERYPNELGEEMFKTAGVSLQQMGAKCWCGKEHVEALGG